MSGILGKVASAAKKAALKPGAVKSGAVAAIKAAAKKAITTTKNTISNNNQKNKGTGKPNVSGRPTTANTKQQKIITTSSKAAGSSSAKKSWGGAITSSVTGIAAGVVRRITPGHSYINNKLFTASSAKERKLCSSGGRATAGAMPTAAAVAPAIPGVFEGLGALLAALGEALAGAVSSAILPAVLIGAAVVGVTVLGIEGYKYLTAGKVAVTPTIAEQILEMARKKKEEQETIKVGPEDYDVLDKDGNVIYEGGGGSQNNNDDNGDEPPAPIEPKLESSGSSSENVPEVEIENKTTEISLEELPENVQNSYKKYQQDGWKGPRPDQTPGTKGGRTYKNLDKT